MLVVAVAVLLRSSLAQGEIYPLCPSLAVGVYGTYVLWQIVSAFSAIFIYFEIARVFPLHYFESALRLTEYCGYP